jgi:hypothetical protein
LTWTLASKEPGAYRLVLRLWKSDYEVIEAQGSEPIYLLSLTRERLRKGMHLYAVPSLAPPSAEEMAEFLSVLARMPAIRLIARTEAVTNPKTVPALVTAAQ